MIDLDGGDMLEFLLAEDAGWLPFGKRTDDPSRTALLAQRERYRAGTGALDAICLSVVTKLLEDAAGDPAPTPRLHRVQTRRQILDVARQSVRQWRATLASEVVRGDRHRIAIARRQLRIREKRLAKLRRPTYA
jgi:hypothetical protein